jgi:small GTP-binding protein
MYDYNFKVILIGDRGTGKNTLARRFLTNLRKPESKEPISVNFGLKLLKIDGKNVKLQIWDFKEEEQFRLLAPTYIRGTEGALLIYDITNYDSLAYFDDWLMLMRKELRVEEQFPILVIGNKVDLDDKREISEKEGIQFAKSRDVDGFFEGSAKTGENIEEIFEGLTKMMIQKSESRNKIIKGKEIP